MSFGDVVRSSSACYWAIGIGGNSDVIWHSCGGDTDQIYELDVSDFSVIKSASSPHCCPNGIGGDASTIWHCDSDTNRVYELSTSNFSVIRSNYSPYHIAIGIGGDSDIIWHCDTDLNKIFELATSDLLSIRSAPSPSTYPYGIGGDANTIWHCDCLADQIYELDVSDFSVIRSASSPGSNPLGVGGDSNVIWHSNLSALYELDAAVNLPPVANCGGPYKTSVNITIEFNGSASTDEDGTIVSWEWDFGDGDSGTGETVEHAYSEPGEYTVALTVTDDQSAANDVICTCDVISDIPDTFSFGRIGKKRRHRIEV